MIVEIPDRFRPEVDSMGPERLDGMRSVAATACLSGSTQAEVAEFLGKDGWSPPFSQWVVAQANAYGHELEFTFPAESSLTVKKREYTEWADQKRKLVRRGLFWLGLGLVLRLATLPSLNGGNPLVNLAGLLGSIVTMAYGTLCILRSRGLHGSNVLLGWYAFLLKDKNVRVPPREEQLPENGWLAAA